MTGYLKSTEITAMSEFGEELRSLRKQTGVSLSKLSQDLGINKSCWSRYENNEHGMKLSTYFKLCKHFNKSIGFQKEWRPLTNQEINHCIVSNNISVVEGDVYEFVKSLEVLIKWNNQ
jgi:transcriptional regulator with XRE-family HTH domain